MSNKESSNGLNIGGFPGALTLLFIALKLLDKIDWPWVWVLSPIWIQIVIFVLVVVIVIVKDWLE